MLGELVVGVLDIYSSLSTRRVLQPVERSACSARAAAILILQQKLSLYKRLSHLVLGSFGMDSATALLLIRAVATES